MVVLYQICILGAREMWGILEIFLRIIYRTEIISGIPYRTLLATGLLDCVNFGSELES